MNRILKTTMMILVRQKTVKPDRKVLLKKNLDRNQTGNVAGMLLYAKTQEQITPNNKYSMDGNTIWVRTLDLNLPFPQIAEQLEKIAGDYFGSGKFDRTGIGTDRRCKEIIEYGI